MNLGPLNSSIDAWMSLSEPASTVILAILGLVAGAMANHVITSWCWFRRPISPWYALDPWPWDEEQRAIVEKLPARSWLDRIPIVGWLRLRRESSLLGRGFWVRPLLIESVMALTLPLMHRSWIAGQLLPPELPPNLLPLFTPWMTLLFFVHAFLLTMMVAATFIDFDERTIPDLITIPGTILGLGLACLTPYIFLPGELPGGIAPVTLQHPVQLAPSWMSGSGLLTCLAIWSIWCFALADRRVILRRGFSKAVSYFFARLIRHGSWKVLAGIWIVGLIAICGVFQIGDSTWLGLASSLMGIAVGGGIVWSIRLVGSWAMRTEAMGFGDVTLMAMIGAYIGWQASTAAFFLAPLAAIAIVLVQFAITRDRATPFGPYLCAGTVLTVLFWDRVYNDELRLTIAAMDEIMGGMLLWLGVALLGLLGGMLWVWRLIKQRILAG
ncbi:prepilin peptidase [Allorhodopirellula solitaria]|uniref:Type 4 prepilin-like proteins leader peptide-processing enzyme n=1 Tax=Allorhodopirellula solitaria TaxID=2527987 RepID=A0A5C5XWH6_9BACT|nr:A24 family peptidase [Allorhodopirellula solitaria]TWT65992.1 Type 4 prepilin-like proteins leader peptide-processing enzyme [Allorhodopirellula solitaria]